MYLLDTNIWLELLLEQDSADQVRSFFDITESSNLFMTEFSLYSIGIILIRLKKDDVFEDFLSDTIDDSSVTRIRLDSDGLKKLVLASRKYGMDFNDAYQYAAAEKHDLTLVSFDSDFDKTERGRKSPAQLLG